MWTSPRDLCPAWATLTLVIIVYFPQCHGQDYGQVEFRIQEQRPSGTKVGSIRNKAHIADKVTAANLPFLSFEFLNLNTLQDTASLFKINEDNGDIYTTVMIDRESVCKNKKDCHVEFDVTVRSIPRSNFNFFEIVGVKIIIEDINDNDPKFPNKEITLFVMEATSMDSTLQISGATDKDTAEQNSVQDYDMISDYSDMFELKKEKKLDGSWDLAIKVLKPLDRETKDHYLLHIVARDNGDPPRTGNMTVHINVTDTNDNPPVFTRYIYNFSVSETAEIGAVVGQVIAKDRDIRMNAEVTYRFSTARTSSIDRLFYIDSKSGEIKVKGNLQYEAGTSSETIVVASDQGNPPRESQAVLILSILDVGNTAPRINVNPVPNPQGNVLILAEDTKLDTVVAHVRTEDRDEGSNGVVDCRSQTSGFRIERFGGRTSGYLLKVSQVMDREEQEEINVTVICEDRGSPKLSAMASFIIKLKDVNDNAPIFSQQIYPANLTENNRKGAHVLRVVATDRDLGENARIEYSISIKDGLDSSASAFNIDPYSGEITAAVEFDREMVSQISFLVQAVDGGQPPLTGLASVVVDIKDINDKTPYFTSSMEFEIPENLPASSHVDKLTADDDDVGVNEEVFFSIPRDYFTTERSEVPFVVIPNGDIRTAAVLNKDDQSLYTFPVMVTDKGVPPRSATSTVTIRVIDSNDHKPMFVFPSPNNNTLHLPFETAPLSVVAELQATDGDTGRNGRLKYAITSASEPNVFRIMPGEADTGRIQLMTHFGYIKESPIRLTVSVRDQGIPVHQVDANLTIYVDYLGRAGSTSNDAVNASQEGLFGVEDVKYVIIAGVIGGITVLTIIVVIVIVILLRRPDRNQRNNLRSATPVGIQEQGDGRHFDKQMWQSVPVDDISPTDNEDRKLGGGLPPLKGGGVISGEPDNPKANGGGFGPNHYTGDLIDPYRKHSTDGYQGQPPLYTFKKCALRAPTDDHQSDTSGETTTSDSGRGGSEEDIQLPPLPELSEDTSRIIFKNPGSGLKDSRFVNSDHPDYSSSRETIAFETFSPRTLPNSGKDRLQYNPRDIQTMANPKHRFQQQQQPISYHTVGGPKPTYNALSSQSSPGQRSISPSASYPSQQPHVYHGVSPLHTTGYGPGYYPDHIPENLDGVGGVSTSGKKVTFQTDLTTQNLKTWELAQKMNLNPEAYRSGAGTLGSSSSGYHSNPNVGAGGHRTSLGSRPRSQDDDDNTTTSGSYTINPDNDLDDSLPSPFISVA